MYAQQITFNSVSSKNLSQSTHDAIYDKNIIGVCISVFYDNSIFKWVMTYVWAFLIYTILYTHNFPKNWTIVYNPHTNYKHR